MIHQVLNDILTCRQCNFPDEVYPPIPPALNTTTPKILFIGENPSWEFGLRVPLDGISHSGKALVENYLIPLHEKLKLKETDFWITNLFKCRYPKELYRNKKEKQDEIFTIAKRCAKNWLLKELTVLNPTVIVTLGDKEVYKRLDKIFQLKLPRNFTKVAYKNHSVRVGEIPLTFVPACHPDISSPNKFKKIATEKWSAIHKKEFIDVMKICLKL